MTSRESKIEEIKASLTLPDLEGFLRDNDLFPDSRSRVRTWSLSKEYLESLSQEEFDLLYKDIMSVQKIIESGTIDDFAKCLDTLEMEYEGERVRGWSNFWENKGIHQWDSLRNYLRRLTSEEREKILKYMTYVVPIYYRIPQDIVVESALRVGIARAKSHVKPWDKAVDLMLDRPDADLDRFVKDVFISHLLLYCEHSQDFLMATFGDKREINSEEEIRTILEQHFDLKQLEFLNENYLSFQEVNQAYFLRAGKEPVEGPAKEPPTLEEPITVFISYRTADSSKYQIPLIASRLEAYPDINEALYWEEDSGYNITVYVNKGIDKCQVMLLFCDERVRKLDEEDPLTKEWTSAQKLNKKVIPVFMDLRYVPPTLQNIYGVEFRSDDLNSTIKAIHTRIKKALQSKK